MSLTFPLVYLKTFETLMTSPDVAFSCRGMKIWKELMAQTSYIHIYASRAAIFSHTTHRVTPIRFVLAELCWILAGRFDVKSIVSYNKAIAHYSDDGKTIGGSYGLRLAEQLPVLVQRLQADMHTRQACASIFDRTDCLNTNKTHMPCNVFLQFICRPPHLYLHVISRSSDFATGFSIDSIHWQVLLIMMANELSNICGETIVPMDIVYTISSLHIYTVDTPVIEQWTVYEEVVPRFSIIEPYGYDLNMRLGLSEAIQRAKDMFKEDLSVEELGNILMLDEMSMCNVKEMHEKFLTHRNKLVR